MWSVIVALTAEAPRRLAVRATPVRATQTDPVLERLRKPDGLDLLP
jgi:hypothetical protein